MPWKKSRNRMSSVAANKGLLNEPGDNNCFMNSAIQVLWHLDVFRRSFRLLSGHSCMGASCIFCALKELFENFEYSKDQALPPNVLRSALATTFQEQNRFQLGLMDDAAECFENILLRIHHHIGNATGDDVCTAPYCIPHQKFGLTLVEQSVCHCGATSEPFSFIEMVHYVSATALCVEDENVRIQYGTSATEMFGRLIRVAGSWGDSRNCPSNCGSKMEMKKVLMNCPDVVSIGIVWDSDEPQIRNIIDLVNTLGTTLRLSDLFHTVVDERANRIQFVLAGMVCYYGKHYSTFFFHTNLKKWVYFDDAQVSEVGKRWSNVIDKCIKGRHQPLLLLYTNPHADPIATDTAPKYITMMPGYEKVLDNGFIPHHRESKEAPPLIDLETSDHDEFGSGTESTLYQNEPVRKSGRHHQKHKQVKEKVDRKEHHKPSESSKPSSPAPLITFSPKKERQHQQQPPQQQQHQLQQHQPHHRHTPSNDLSGIRHLASKTQVTEKQSKKPTFSWNNVDDAPKKNRDKFGHYVEPSPAQWTKYKPYQQDQKVIGAASVVDSSKISQLNQHQNKSTSNVAVKAVSSNGGAAFCITSTNHPPPAAVKASETPRVKHSPKMVAVNQNNNELKVKPAAEKPVPKVRRTISQSSSMSQTSTASSSSGSGSSKVRSSDDRQSPVVVNARLSPSPTHTNESSGSRRRRSPSPARRRRNSSEQQQNTTDHKPQFPVKQEQTPPSPQPQYNDSVVLACGNNLDGFIDKVLAFLLLSKRHLIFLSFSLLYLLCVFVFMILPVLSLS